MELFDHTHCVQCGHVFEPDEVRYSKVFYSLCETCNGEYVHSCPIDGLKYQENGLCPL